MKKICTLLIIFTLTFVSFFCKFSVKATNDSSNLTNPSTEFRAAWVSYYTGDISYKNEKDYKNQIDQILDTMEYYNMNAMIFHIRMLGIILKSIKLIDNCQMLIFQNLIH